MDRHLKNSDDSILMNGYLKESDDSILMNRHLKESDNSILMNRHLKNSDDSILMNGYLKESDDSILMNGYLKESDDSILMDRSNLEKLTKSQLIELLLKQGKKKPKVVIVDTKPTRLNRPPPLPEVLQRIKPTPPPRTGKWENVKPKPAPRKSVEQMVKEYEENIIQPPEQFRPIPKPRTDRPLQMRRPPKPTRKPPPPPIPEGESSQHKITQLRKALKGSTKSFTVDVINNEDPLHQLNETKNFIKKCLVEELLELKGFKYIETLKATFEKKQGNGITTKTTFFNSKTKTLINAMEINEVLQSSREELVKAIAQWLSEGSGWTIQSVDAHYINLTQYQPLKGVSI